MEYVQPDALAELRQRLSADINGLTLLEQGHWGKGIVRHVGKPRIASLKGSLKRMQSALRPKNESGTRMPVNDYQRFVPQLEQVESLLSQAKERALQNESAAEEDGPSA
jgi:hypothetical protein